MNEISDKAKLVVDQFKKTISDMVSGKIETKLTNNLCCSWLDINNPFAINNVRPNILYLTNENGGIYPMRLTEYIHALTIIQNCQDECYEICKLISDKKWFLPESVLVPTTNSDENSEFRKNHSYVL